ncbi:RrF2 family transcriptional regulator [Pseudomonas sp. NPDC078700]|uniref:RrF2 family transcriptional regulator n=1 Tax=Pseudomonas sp. NPDC078700 TaxID=3364424 RepID=UPI0037C6A7E7
MSFYSAGVEYGIHCLLFLVDEQGRPREASVRDLAELQGVPQEYLAKVFTKLAKAGLVVSTEGVKGGFKLARGADAISVLDIVIAIDGRKDIFDCREIRSRCALFEGSPPSWAQAGTCTVHGVMLTAQKRMEEALKAQTILDMAKRVGRAVPNEFASQVGQWMNQRREAKKDGPAEKAIDHKQIS